MGWHLQARGGRRWHLSSPPPSWRPPRWSLQLSMTHGLFLCCWFPSLRRLLWTQLGLTTTLRSQAGSRVADCVSALRPWLGVGLWPDLGFRMGFLPPLRVWREMFVGNDCCRHVRWIKIRGSGAALPQVPVPRVGIVSTYTF